MSSETQKNFKKTMEKIQKENELKARYLCPACKTENMEHQKYCISCGTWLLSSAFPATKVSKPKSSGKAKKVFGWIILSVLIIIGLSRIESLPVSIPGTSSTAKFGDMAIGEKYVISQMEVDRKRPAVTADFKSKIDTAAPVEVSAVFYDATDSRLGKATSLIGSGLSKEQVTTLTFNFEGAVGDLSKIANVRVEVQELSPLMLLERTANKLNSVQ